MSKAEERAQAAYPAWRNGLYDEFNSNSAYCGFIKGYHQAEKDLELTWKDMEQIYNICCEVFLDYEVTRTNMQKIWKEVLKRFKDFKERKEK